MLAVVEQLKQRQVFKVATIYAVSAWPLIQVADLAVPALGLPDSVMTLLLQIFLIGFPITLVFAWLYNFTASGIVRANQDEGDDNAQVNLQTTLMVVGILVIALLSTLASHYFCAKKDTSVAIELQPVANSANSKANTINAGPIAEKPSIAVLPFVPFSQDPADEFFADGMVEELLNLLAKTADLQVAARTSSFAYKGVSNKTIQQIGRELGVDTILEGSIRKNDVTNQIRVTAQLITVSTGEHLWSETFDREYRDIFQIQDDIAKAVVSKMKLTLLGAAEAVSNEISSVPETTNVDAMVAFGKGQQELSHRTIPSLNKALEHFKQAVHHDANYARAYVGIADANILLAEYGNLSYKIAQINAEKALETALTIDDQLAAAYASLGLLWSGKDTSKAEQYYKKAIALNASYAMAYMWYGSLLQNQGKLDQSHQLFEQAFELDPRSPVAAFNVASGYYQLGNEAKAMEMFSHIIANDPYYPSAYNLVADILSDRGRLDEAMDMYNRALEVDDINKHALRGLLNSAMDLNDDPSVKKWFEVAENSTEIFSNQELQLLNVRRLSASGEGKLAIKMLANVSYPENKLLNTMIKAEVAFYQQEYAQALSYYQQLMNLQKGNRFFAMFDGQAALHLAYAAQQLEQNEQAQQLITDYLAYLQQDIVRKENNPDYFYTMASISAINQRNDEVLQYLQAAIDSGWVKIWQAKTEPHFDYLAKTTQFNQMLGGVEARLTTMKRRMNEETFLLESEGFAAFN